MTIKSSITIKKNRQEVRQGILRSFNDQPGHPCALHQLILSSISDAAFIVGPDGKIIYANPSAAGMFGWDTKEFIGRSLREIIFRKKADGTSDRYEECPMGASPRRAVIRQRGDTTFWKKDGSVLNMEHICIPIIEDDLITGAVVVCRDVGEKKRTREKLISTHARMLAEQLAMRQKNIALKEILNQIENEKRLIKRQIQNNIEKVAMPILKAIEDRISPSQRDYVMLLKESLKDIASPFISKLDSHYSKLTPKELEICNMIKNGLTSKQIASAMSISLLTVHKHRQVIRRKLGITNEDANLVSFLKSL